MKFKALVPTNLRSTRWLQFFEAMEDYVQEFKTNKLKVLEDKFIPENSSSRNLRDLIERKGYRLIETEGYTSTMEYFRRRAEALPTEVVWLLSNKCYREVLKSFWLVGESFGLDKDFDGFFYPRRLVGNTNSVDQGSQLLDQEVDIIFFFIGGVPVPNPPLQTFQPALFLDSFEFPNLDLDSQRSGSNHFLIDYGFYVVEDKDVFISRNTSRALFDTVRQIHRMKEIPHYRPVIRPKVLSDKQPTIKPYTTYDQDSTKNSNMESIYLNGNFNLVQYVEIGTDPHPVLTPNINRANVSLGVLPVSGLFDVIRQSVSGMDIEYKVLESGRLSVSGTNVTNFSEVCLLDENLNGVAYVKFPKIFFDRRMLTSLKIEIDAVNPT